MIDKKSFSSDYSPVQPGTPEHSQAAFARREMLTAIAATPVSVKGQRKNHDRRVQNNYNIIMKRARAAESALGNIKVA